MPNNADVDSKIEFPLHEVSDPFQIKNAFDDKTFKSIKDKVLSINWGPGSDHHYHTTIGRWDSGVEFDEETNKSILDSVRKYFNNDKLELAYYFAVRYQRHMDSVPDLWPHIDQNAAQYSVDLCIEKNNIDWSLNVDNFNFTEEENSAIFMHANQQVHSRPPYPTEDENAYIVVLLMSFLEPGHWFLEGKNNYENSDEFMGLNLRKLLDGDIRFFELNKYVSFHRNDNEICACHDYRQVYPRLAEVYGDDIYNY